MIDFNFEQARYNMVEQQIRPWDVIDQDVLDLIMKLPREDFVPEEFRTLALSDLPTPIGEDEVTMPPKLEARMLQTLAIRPDETVLEIGTGCGYVTALLASLARHVYSVEIKPALLAAARERLTVHGFVNVTLEEGDAARGWDRHAPYDVILVTGSLPVLPDTLKQSLRVGGRMFVIVGDAPSMSAQLISRVGENDWHTESLFETDVPPLQNAPQPERFVF